MDDDDDYRWPVTSREDIRRILEAGRAEPAGTPPGGWTGDNVGPELGRIMLACRPIVIRLPPGDALFGLPPE